MQCNGNGRIHLTCYKEQW